MGTQVYQDSAGNHYEVATPVDPATASLPLADFTPAQAAMATLPLPFRNIIRDPFIAAIGPQAVTTPYPQSLLDEIAAKSCSSFRIVNPNLCYIRFRRASDASDLIKEDEGRLLAPGAAEVFSTQNPTFLSIMPVARPGYPIASELAPVELSYGIGS